VELVGHFEKTAVSFRQLGFWGHYPVHVLVSAALLFRRVPEDEEEEDEDDKKRGDDEEKK
jgi:hypothetical protein